MIHWICLFLAGCVEIVGVIMMKKVVSSNNKIFLLGLFICFAFSFSLLSVAMKGISMGVAYAIWTGIGAGGGVVAGILFFNENKSLAKLFFVALIIFSSIGLKLLS